MTEELKNKILDTLNQYDGDLETLWWNTDSTMNCDHYRQRQKDLAILIDEVRELIS